MKHKVRYLTDKKPHIEVMIRSISDGVWLLYCDFYERYVYDACGYDGDSGESSVIFGDDDACLMEVSFTPPEESVIFGDMSKKTFHGFIIADRVYKRVMA